MTFDIITSTRADWGLLKPLADALRQRGCEVEVIATNMHLLPECGYTVTEIEADGYRPIRLEVHGDRAQIASEVLLGTARHLGHRRPDALILLGDRFEILAAAQGALLAEIPVIHIAGGAISEGAIDDSCRHAITKMASLHLAETERYAQRIVQMGEEPGRVAVTGAVGVQNLLAGDLMACRELSADIGLDMSQPTLLVTLHPATVAPDTPAEQMQKLLQALARLPEDMQILFTYPNNDVDPAPQVAMIEAFASLDPQRRKVVPSLGRRRYLSALQYVTAVVGNSSSGIVEVPSAGIPTLDIRPRQNGRDHAASVLRVDNDPDAILAGLLTVLTPEFRGMAAAKDNPYHREDTVNLMVEAILTRNWRSPKRFHDL